MTFSSLFKPDRMRRLRLRALMVRRGKLMAAIAFGLSLAFGLVGHAFAAAPPYGVRMQNFLPKSVGPAAFRSPFAGQFGSLAGEGPIPRNQEQHA